MNKFKIAIVMIAITLLSGEKIDAAQYSCDVDYKEDTTANGIEVEDTIIKVNYPDASKAKYRWYVEDWVLTTDEVVGYTVPDDAEVLKDTKKNNNVYELSSVEVFNDAVKLGAIPDFTTGEVIAYAQPVITIEEYTSTGDWQVVKHNVRSLEEWKASADWKGLADFKLFYNKKVKVRVETTVTTNTGNVYVNVGSVKSLEDLGVTETTDNNKQKHLVGIKVDGSLDKDGKQYNQSAMLEFQDTKVSDGTFSITDTSKLIDVDGRNVLFAKDGYVVDNTQNSFYDSVSCAEFRIGFQESVVANYQEFGTAVTIVTRNRYLVANTQYSIGNTKKKTVVVYGNEYNLNEAGSTTVRYAGSDKWELDSISVAVEGETVTAPVGEIVKKEDSGTSINTVLDITKSTKWIVQFDYVVNAPQIELSYFKDSEGNLTLFEMTSNGATINGANWKRNLYGVSASNFGFSRYKEDITVKAKKRDLVLTRAYAYGGPGNGSVSGYLNDINNCWSTNEEPTGGRIVSYTVDNQSRQSVWTLSDRDNALTESANDGISKTLKLTVDSTPMNPLIYVAVYEELPTVYTVSYFTSDDKVNNNTVLQKLEYSYGTFDYDDVEYDRGKKVTLRLGTDSVAAYSAYAQDGVDDGIVMGMSARATDDVRGTLTIGEDQILYCTRYAWVTGEAGRKLADSGDIKFGDLKNVGYAGLSSSSLGGRLRLGDGSGTLVKVFTKEIKNTGDSRWAATYQYLEDDSKSYKRLQRTQLIGDFRNVIENSTSDIAIQPDIGTTLGMPMLQLTSVASQVRNETIDRQDDVASGGGHTYEYHSTLADAIATDTLAGMEGNNAYGNWLTGDDNQFSWLNKAYQGQALRTWNWYVYRYSKSINYASVLKTVDNSGKISYSSEDGYSKKKLNPYTEEYEFSFVPFKEDKSSGKIYVLTSIVYGYGDVKESVFDESVFSSMENSVSTIHKYRGGRVTLYGGNFESSKTNNGTDTAMLADNSVQSYKVDSEQLKVVGIYTEYTASGAKQESPKVTEDVISFRDTGVIDSTGKTTVTINSASVNSVNDADSDARFVGEIMNDVDNSSDSYRASSAIPTSEYIRISVSAPKYLADLDFNKNTVSVTYTPDYCKAFYKESKTTDKYGNEVVKYSGELREARPSVQRTAVNYSLRGSTIWYPEDATVWNYAISEDNDQHVTMVRTSAKWMNDLVVKTSDSAEFSFPNYVDDSGEATLLLFWEGVSKVDSTDDVIYNSGSKLESAESEIGEITATNQRVVFYNGDGEEYVLLEHQSYSTITDEPVDAPAAKKVPADLVNKKGDTVNRCFSSKNDNTRLPWGEQRSTTALKIDNTKDNGIYESTGVIRYVTNSDKIEQHGISYHGKDNKNYSAVDNGICYGLGVNDVIILTPAVVTVAISDESVDDQSITTSVGYPLILDKRFTIATSAIGSFNGLPGYGTKNYAKYLNKMKNSGDTAIRLRFPFVTVRIRMNANGEEVYDAIPANTWLTVGLGNTSFILPTFVEEGDFQNVEVRAYPINLTKTSEMKDLEYASNTNRKALTSEIKNSDDGWNYVAYRILETSVIGRVYELTITDISDYPLWQNVFRNSDGELSEYKFYSGLANQNTVLRGNLSDRCFPIIDGDHPKYANEGFSKLGYVTKFELETVGSMYSSTDLISVIPQFYWVDEDGKNRTKVNLYYDADINGEKKLAIKVGSDEDRKNKHYYNLANGDFGIAANRLTLTADSLGFDDTQAFTNRKTPVYSFGELQLNQYVRIFNGDLHNTYSGLQSVLLNGMIMESGKGLNVPDSLIERSVQKWYGQYYLPTNLHVTDKSEEELMQDKDWRLYKNVNNWKTDGYLIVNFTIRTVNDSKYSLIYDAEKLNDKDTTEWHYDSGHCNMWEKELFPAVKKSSNGTVFTLESGDFLIYDVKDFGIDDADNYSGGGTH